jgi:hypothetical protein
MDILLAINYSQALHAVIPGKHGHYRLQSPVPFSSATPHTLTGTQG